MPLSLSHLAEDIFARMANQSREAFIAATRLDAETDIAFVREVPEFATCEARLEPVCGRAFDGACRVDVIVRVRPGFAAAFELKLGTTRLTKTRVDEEWLRECAPSHEGRRWRGHVMAVLDRRFDGGGVEPLSITTAGERLELIRPWFFVARRKILLAWKGNPPDLGSHVHQVAFEDVVAAYGDATAFNALVREMLDVDFHDTWVIRDPDAVS